MLELAGRIVSRTPLTGDALGAYAPTVENALGPNIDFGQLVRSYGVGRGNKPEASEPRYRLPKRIGTTNVSQIGHPATQDIGTSRVERSNLTIRMRCFKRLTVFGASVGRAVSAAGCVRMMLGGWASAEVLGHGQPSCSSVFVFFGSFPCSWHWWNHNQWHAVFVDSTKMSAPDPDGP